MENRKYIVHLSKKEVFSYEVEAKNEDEAIDKVYQGEVEAYDSEILEKYVTDCVLIEPEEKYEPDTPLEGCALF
jgi:hypothetical protein